MKTRATLLVTMLLVVLGPASLAAEPEEKMIVMTHLGGNLAVKLDAVETVFYLEKDGKQRFHLVWQGNAEGKTIEGPEGSNLWRLIQSEWKDRFFWASHMGGSIGISRDAVTSIFFMPEKDGKKAMLRINYGADSKAIEGADAEVLWKSLSQ